MTHVWQYQHAKAVKTRGLAVGILSIVSAPYEYELDTSKTLNDYGLEQQASIVGDYYAVREHLKLGLYATNSRRPTLQDYEAVIKGDLKNQAQKYGK